MTDLPAEICSFQQSGFCVSRNACFLVSDFVSFVSLFQVAKDSSVEKLITRLKEWYFEKEGEKSQLVKLALKLFLCPVHSAGFSAERQVMCVANKTPKFPIELEFILHRRVGTRGVWRDDSRHQRAKPRRAEATRCARAAHRLPRHAPEQERKYVRLGRSLSDTCDEFRNALRQ